MSKKVKVVGGVMSTLTSYLTPYLTSTFTPNYNFYSTPY